MPKSIFAPAQEFFDLWLETYRGTFGRLWETPAVGPAREKTEQAMKGFTTFANFYAAWINSNVELQAVFMEAMRRTQEKLASGEITEIRPDSYKDLYKIWMDTYSETFDEFLKSGDFATDLGELMAESMEFQRFIREMLEENYLKPMNLPTKTEIDEANKEVYALKKAIKEADRRTRGLPTRAETDELRADIDETNSVVRSLTRSVDDTDEKISKLPTRAEVAGIKTEAREINAELRSLKRAVKDMDRKTLALPAKREFDKVRKDLDSLKQTVKGLATEIKKQSKKK